MKMIKMKLEQQYEVGGEWKRLRKGQLKVKPFEKSH